MINPYTETDRRYLRIIRSRLGDPWEEARPRIVAELNRQGLDPDLIPKFVDERDAPGIHINAYGFEPRFYPHRTSKRLLEFYRSVG